MTTQSITAIGVLLIAGINVVAASPAASEPELGLQELPTVRVGQSHADIVGSDNRALQAALDYVARLGGGVVEIGPGEYRMADSLHLRSFVTVRGTPGKTVLRKDDAVASSLSVDGDFGESQVTVAHSDPTGGRRAFAADCPRRTGIQPARLPLARRQ